MDSPAITSLFRQLFTTRARQCLRSRALQQCAAPAVTSRVQRRSMASNGPESVEDSIHRRTSNWHPRLTTFPEEKIADVQKYPTVTARDLRMRRQRPKRVKMLMRDFIEDSLYNPYYGYFSKEAIIFSPGEPFDFKSLKNDKEFHQLLGHRYTTFEDELDKKEPNDVRQLWHTPTELFRPFYGEAIGRYLVTNYKLNSYPYHDLLIYEMGAGNGTLMLNILDYIRDTHPEVYERTKYRVIEISPALAAMQTSRLAQTAESRGHDRKVEIINRSIFEWKTYVSSPCFFLALEVFDNFAHDVLRYDPITEEALQGHVFIDVHGEMYEYYSRSLDASASRFLRVRDAACSSSYNHPLSTSRTWRAIRSRLPFAANLTEPEYIPTRLMDFFDILYTYFPAHKLVTSDFHYLPNAIKGVNAPVVQTRYQRQTVPVTTPLVHQGYFDILFPTDFAVMEDIYRAITGKLTRVMTHEDYMKRWAYVKDTQAKNGENPLLNWYENASVMVTV